MINLKDYTIWQINTAKWLSVVWTFIVCTIYIINDDLSVLWWCLGSLFIFWWSLFTSNKYLNYLEKQDEKDI